MGTGIAGASLDIAGDLSTAWQSLPPAARLHAATFLRRTRHPVDNFTLTTGISMLDVHPFPSTPWAVAALTRRVRSAFPRLTRTLVAIESTRRVWLRILCVGQHEGNWFAALPPTGRRVEFEECHELVLEGAQLAEVHVRLDLVSVLRQIRGEDAAAIAPARYRRNGAAPSDWRLW